MNVALACSQLTCDMQEGDAVYVKRGRHLIVGQGVIASGYATTPLVVSRTSAT